MVELSGLFSALLRVCQTSIILWTKCKNVFGNVALRKLHQNNENYFLVLNLNFAVKYVCLFNSYFRILA